MGYAAVSIFIKKEPVDIADMMSSLTSFREAFTPLSQRLGPPVRQLTHGGIASLVEENLPKINCPVCLEDKLAAETSFLSCAHSICTDCLEELHRYNNHVRCPICRHTL